MKSLRFKQSFIFPMAFALLGALFLPPTWGGWVHSAMTLLVSPISGTVRGVAGAVNLRVTTPRRSLSEEHDGAKSYEQLQNELETLKSQFMALQDVNAQLQATLNDRKDWPKDLLKKCNVARVVGGDAGNNQQSLTLQPGSLDNPVQDAAVIVSYDIVGRLKIVGPGTAKVVLITDRGSSNRGEFTHYLPDGSGVERLGIYQTLTGDGKDGMYVTVKLADITHGPGKEKKIKRGDRVVLSDRDWPQNLQGFCLGEVDAFSDAANPLFCKISIRPRLELMKLKEVMVLKKEAAGG